MTEVTELANGGETGVLPAEDHGLPRVPPDVMVAGPYHVAFSLRVREMTNLKKSTMTRLRLLAATARILEADGLANLKVTQIADAASAAHGTFYSYFPDKRVAVEAVLTAFAADVVGAIQWHGSAAHHGGNHYQGIRRSIVAIAASYRLNPGLSRCLWQLDDSGTAFEHVLQDINERCHQRVSASLLRRAGLPPSSGREATLITYALAAMVDEFLIQYYLRRDPVLRALGLADEEVVETLAFLWHRGAYGRDPDAADLSGKPHEKLLERLRGFR